MASTKSKVRKSTDEPEYLAFMARLVRNMVRRSEDHSIDSLRSIVTVQRLLDDTTAEIVAYLRSSEGGACSWAQVGDALGITKQSAQQRFGGEGARRPGGQPSELR